MEMNVQNINSNENHKATVPSTNHDRSKTAAEWGILKIFLEAW